MAKNIRKVFAMILVLCFLLCSMPMQVLAEETEVTVEGPTITTEDGLSVSTTTTTQVSSVGSSTTVSVTVEKQSEGTNSGGQSVRSSETTVSTDSTTRTTDDNTVQVQSQTVTQHEENKTTGDLRDFTETSVTTTVTDAAGNQLSEVWTLEGEETTSSHSGTPEDPNKESEPKVEVTLNPGQTVTEYGGISDTETSTETDGDGIITTTTTFEADRTVTASSSEITVTEEEIKTELTPLDVNRKLSDKTQDYTYGSYGDKPMNTAKHFDLIGGKYVPRIVRTDDQMLPAYKSYYTRDPETGLWTPNAASRKENITDYHGGEFFYTTNGEEGWLSMLMDDGWNSGYYRDVGGAKLEGDIPAGSLRVCDIYGNIRFVYCLDQVTGTIESYDYTLENLEGADYFEGTPEEQAAAKDHVRAIALYGYWGASDEPNEDGSLKTGSLAKMKEDLKAFIENNPDFTFTYNDPGMITGEEIKTESKTFNAGTDKEAILAMVDRLTYAGAVAVMNSAFWEYGRGELNPEQIFDKDAWETDPEFNYALVLLREYLLSDELVAQMQEKEADKATTIYDADSFIAKDSLKLTVGDKIEDLELNTDDDQNNDVYRNDLSFSLVVAPDQNKDNLVVTLVDSNGVVICKARIAGDNSQDDDTFAGADQFLKEDGVYTFIGIPMQEGSDITFNLKLEGIQYLEQGVYIYKSATGDYDNAQTLVGLAEGNRTVDVSAAFTLTFSVDESNRVVTKKTWRNGGDPQNAPGDPTNGDFPIPESDDPDPQPAAVYDLRTTSAEDGGAAPMAVKKAITIPDEPIPLAKAPQTGDLSNLWAVLSGLSLSGMALLNAKRKEEE